MTDSIGILLYHSVDRAVPEQFQPWSVTPERFAAHLDRIVDLGYTTLTVSDLVHRLDTGTALPERTVVITFDDGFADFAAQAWPLLDDRGLASTLYVTAGAIGGTSVWLEGLGAGEIPMLTVPQLRALDAGGVEIGSHSMHHPHLDCLPLGEAEREITESKDVLESLLGHAVDSFAYPHGYHNRRVKEATEAAGYTSATAVRNRLSHASDDRYALARVTITAGYTADDLELVLEGGSVELAHQGERLQTSLWRQVRRIRHRTRWAA